MVSRDGQISAVNAALRILEYWGCSHTQKRRILGVTQVSPGQTDLTAEQLERVSHILNIHAALRTVFNNPANVYGFMTMTNNNPGFDGLAPLDLIDTGTMEDLALVAKKVRSLAEGLR